MILFLCQKINSTALVIQGFKEVVPMLFYPMLKSEQMDLNDTFELN